MTKKLPQNLAQNNKTQRKNVMMSPRTLIQFFQELNPQISQKEFQGKTTEASIKSRVQEHGELDAKDYIPGTEVLEVERENAENDQDGWGNTSLREEEAGAKWVDVHHSSDEKQQEVSEKLNGFREKPECPIKK